LSKNEKIECYIRKQKWPTNIES